MSMIDYYERMVSLIKMTSLLG